MDAVFGGSGIKSKAEVSLHRRNEVSQSVADFRPLDFERVFLGRFSLETCHRLWSSVQCKTATFLRLSHSHALIYMPSMRLYMHMSRQRS